MACSCFLWVTFWARETTTGHLVLASYGSGSERLKMNCGFLTKLPEIYRQ